MLPKAGFIALAGGRSAENGKNFSCSDTEARAEEGRAGRKVFTDLLHPTPGCQACREHTEEHFTALSTHYSNAQNGNQARESYSSAAANKAS